MFSVRYGYRQPMYVCWEFSCSCCTATVLVGIQADVSSAALCVRVGLGWHLVAMAYLLFLSNYGLGFSWRFFLTYCLERKNINLQP
jgi:hypothetical protein